MLSATRIRLRAVPPAAIYAQSWLLGFQEEVNRGLADLVSAKFRVRLDLDVCFERLPADFDWRPGAGSAGTMLERRTAVHGSRH